MKIKLILFSLILISSLYSQADLRYYLPQEITYDENIITPNEAFGFEIGDWHLSPGQTLKYLETLDQQSDRIKLIYTGKSHEHRPTVLLVITSPANHDNLDDIKTERTKFLNPKTTNQVNIEELPLVVWLGYSIHGNEPSGHNASPLMTYYLAAAQSTEVENLLDSTIILIEPFVNPDGLNRFATWVNMHKGKNLVDDSYNREHREYWPSGRTNHYWFDLNRDWMPAQHPETRGRLHYLYQWLPNILNDHHEMGSNSTFFFQPGIKSRNNPMIPQRTYELTGKIAKYHAKALDKIGSLYFSREVFDDFYIGKGSSVTDIIGIIGILYEQASSRGHIQKSVNGPLSFPFTIKNQFTASLSTLEAATEMRTELHQHQRDFFREAYKMAEKDINVAYILGSNDPKRNHELKKLLHLHQIEVFELARNIKLNKYLYKKDRDFVVPLKQKQYRMIVSMFEERTSFKDSLFYDISSWNLAHSFNLQFAKIKSETQLQDLKGKSFNNELLKPGIVVSEGNLYAYLMSWDSYNSASALNMILNKDIRCKVAQKPFEISIEGKARQFKAGTIMMPVTSQAVKPSEIASIMDQIAEKKGIDVFGVSTGMSTKGIDLGSFNFAALDMVKPMLLAGQGISSGEAGEVWHLLDKRLDFTCPVIDITDFNKLNLTPYNVIIMVNGDYSKIDSAGVIHLKDWLNLGGTLIATRSANKWLKKVKLAKIDFKEAKKVNKDTVTVRRKYSDAWNFRGAQAIGGSIFKADLDLSHPLGYGFERRIIPIFKRSQLFMKQNPNPYDTPLLFKEKPLLCGYISKTNYELIENSGVINVFGVGKGRIISFIENPNFRAIWYGTNRLFMNALMFGQIIRSHKY